MDPILKKLHLSLGMIILLVAVSACDAIPLDFFPKPPTPIPGMGSTISPTTSIDQMTPTAPGFPTSPVIDTQVPLVVTETPVPILEITETRQLPEPAVTLPPTPTPRPEPFFTLQPGGPQPLVNIAKPESGCNWMGIGGQVFDLQGIPLVNYLVEVEGELSGQQISILALTGGAPQLGPGGYLLEIASQPIESNGMLYLQVLDLNSRVLSEKIFITTYSSCDKNLILVNFTQLPPDMNNRLFLPGIIKE